MERPPIQQAVAIAGLAIFLAVGVGGAARAVTFEWASIGDPGNDPDPIEASDGTSGYGSVPYVYRIALFEVTQAQFAEFLNAVAATDTYSLYHENQSDGEGGIARIGTPGSYTYEISDARGNRPMVSLTFFTMLRFINWLHNDQPTGVPQDENSTEDGAYTLCGLDCVGDRNPGARYFLPSEDEWYKAAYYDAETMEYRNYGTGFDEAPDCEKPPGGMNSANCDDVPSDFFLRGSVDVGSYTDAMSPYGLFDTVGNVFEFTEGIILVPTNNPQIDDGVRRNMRGGSWVRTVLSRIDRNRRRTNSVYNDIGFRVAAAGEAQPAPEPAGSWLSATALLTVAALGSRRRCAGAFDAEPDEARRPRSSALEVFVPIR